MEIPINKEKPLVMHIDLNSCFATIHQQAFIHLRNKPLVIAAYSTPNGCILSPSIEAKELGIKTGMRVKDAQVICPKIIVRIPDTALVRDVHLKFRKIFTEYSPKVIPKSIDEAILDFQEMEGFLKKDLLAIGQEIKNRMRREIGEWISCSVGIGTNRFLAKTAASLKKPDGLEIIHHQNLEAVYKKLTLTDLYGINRRFAARLNIAGICTPLQFLQAPLNLLRHHVFKSICGYYWFLRLRGYEVDDFETERKSYGQEYSLGKKTNKQEELKRLLMKLCEKMGRRLRRSGNAAYGIHLGMMYADNDFWHKGIKFKTSSFSTQELFKKALIIFQLQPQRKIVAKLAVSCYGLVPASINQLDLFEDGKNKINQLSSALDKINDRFGEFTITPALMLDLQDVAVDRIAFGNVKEFSQPIFR